VATYIACGIFAVALSAFFLCVLHMKPDAALSLSAILMPVVVFVGPEIIKKCSFSPSSFVASGELDAVVLRNGARRSDL